VWQPQALAMSFWRMLAVAAPDKVPAANVCHDELLAYVCSSGANVVLAVNAWHGKLLGDACGSGARRGASSQHRAVAIQPEK